MKAILVHTQREWGKAQRLVYMEELRSGIRFVGRNPESGIPQDDLSPGLRMRPCGRHMIYWTVEEHHTIVVRVLHMRQDREAVDWKRSQSTQ